MTSSTITGQTPSHKNSKQLSINRRTGKMFPRNNDNYLAWKSCAIRQAKQLTPLAGTVTISMTFFVQDRRRRDLDNMAASVLDVLSEAGVIEDDNVFVVPELILRFGGVDRKKPRVEVYCVRMGESWW